MLYAETKRYEVVELHTLAVEQELLDAPYCVLKNALDGASREGCVVVCHVSGETVDVQRLVCDDAGEILAVGRCALQL